MRALPSLVLALFVVIRATAVPIATAHQRFGFLTQLKTTHVVIGSVADILVDYQHAGVTTVMHVIEFSTDPFPNEPMLLEMRFCGGYSKQLEAAVHTNVTVIYDLRSPNRRSGCLRLISVEPWRDDSPWQTITLQGGAQKRRYVEIPIQSIVDGASVF